MAAEAELVVDRVDSATVQELASLDVRLGPEQIAGFVANRVERQYRALREEARETVRQSRIEENRLVAEIETLLQADAEERLADKQEAMVAAFKLFGVTMISTVQVSLPVVCREDQEPERTYHCTTRFHERQKDAHRHGHSQELSGRFVIPAAVKLLLRDRDHYARVAGEASRAEEELKREEVSAREEARQETSDFVLEQRLLGMKDGDKLVRGLEGIAAGMTERATSRYAGAARLKQAKARRLAKA
jgi:hypothetical protein